MMSPSSPNAIEARRCQPWRLVKPAAFIRPCQPFLAERPPSGPDWQHETTWDGYRTLHPHLKLTARGILIASKEEIRKRLGRSPGKGDAVAMAWSGGNKAAMARARKPATPYRPPPVGNFYAVISCPGQSLEVPCQLRCHLTGVRKNATVFTIAALSALAGR